MIKRVMLLKCPSKPMTVQNIRQSMQNKNQGFETTETSTFSSHTYMPLQSYRNSTYNTTHLTGLLLR